MSFAFHQLKKRVTALVVRFARTVLFVVAILTGGLASSCYVVDAGMPLTTERHGPWVTWSAAARPDADPYTRAHFARLGALPLSGEFALLFVARTDSSGGRLHSSCTYVLEGRDLPSHWWSLTVYTEEGRLISNSGDRYSFTSDTIALRPDGTYTVTLARDAQPNNWLPTGGAGRLVVAYQMIDLGVQAVARDADIAKSLPEIKRTSCR